MYHMNGNRLTEACEGARTTPAEVSALTGIPTRKIVSGWLTPAELDQVAHILGLTFKELALA